MNLDSTYSIKHNQYPEIGTPDIRRKIANELRSAREFNEASLDQIRSITKINNVYLENLEAGNWSFLPAVYVKLFIKAYADAVGIQSDEFTNRLDEVFESIKPTIQSIETPEYFGNQIKQTRQSRSPGFFSWAEKNRSIIFYGAITIFAIVIIGWYLMRPTNMPSAGDENEPFFMDNEPTQEDTTVVKEEIVETTAEATPVITESIIPEMSTFNFHLVAQGTCYVKIEHEDSTFYERTLWPENVINDQLPDPVRLTLGNALGVRIVVNGDTLAPFTGTRKVRVLKIGAEGIIR